MEGEWSCYRGGQFKEGESLWRWPVSRKDNGRYRSGHFNKSHVTEVVSLMEGEWSCYRGGTLMQGEWLCYGGGQFNGGSKVMLGGQVNGGRMVMLHWWSV